jgi:hypothetical protein
MRLPLLLVLALLVAAPPAAAAKHHRIDVPRTLAPQLAAARPDVGVPILLPSRYIAERKRLFGSGGATEGGYAFGLAFVDDCGGANACSTAVFSAERGGELSAPRHVTLTGGVEGRFRGLSCGASCSDPSIEWIQDGVLYVIQAAAGTRRTERRRMIDLANSAIRNGPR